MTVEQSIRDRGLAIRATMFPDRVGQSPNAPEQIRDDWGQIIVDMYGSVWGRPGLPLRTRSVITVAALTALHLPTELRLHIPAALRNGVSRRELCEIVLHVAGYAGVPKGVEGMRALREMFEAAPGPGPARSHAGAAAGLARGAVRARHGLPPPALRPDGAPRQRRLRSRSVLTGGSSSPASPSAPSGRDRTWRAARPQPCHHDDAPGAAPAGQSAGCI
ncbi:MAG: carboxymuconolactone decarboxylase family protein [Dehalococcoidia bacterium]